MEPDVVDGARLPQPIVGSGLARVERTDGVVGVMHGSVHSRGAVLPADEAWFRRRFVGLCRKGVKRSFVTAGG